MTALIRQQAVAACLTKFTYAVYAPGMGIDEEVATSTHPSIATIWWYILGFL